MCVCFLLAVFETHVTFFLSLTHTHAHAHTHTHTHMHAHTHARTHTCTCTRAHTRTHTHTHTHAQSFNELRPNEFEVVAMYDYAGLEHGDLALTKGSKVIVYDDSRQYWWRARDETGYISLSVLCSFGMLCVQCRHARSCICMYYVRV